MTPTPIPAREARPWTRWWWPGSAADPAGLRRELEALAAAGFGGVEITPVYGMRGGEDRFIPYLSPRWMELLAFTIREAGALGLGVDMATGTGWPFGGPGVEPADADARVERAPDGRLVSRPTGFKVKRAAPGGEGLVLNPYSPAALRRYLALFDAAFEASGAPSPRAQFHDSFEYKADWTPELPRAFRALRGYDLEAHAAALFGEGDPDTAARVRADYRRTLHDLFLEYIRTWTAWAHGRGSLSRHQAHGAPGNLLDLYAAADIPETETFGSTPFAIPGLAADPDAGRDTPNPLIAQFASSAAHTQGLPLVACESCTWLREHFTTALAHIKPELDRMFLAGINHVLFHGTCHSPAGLPWPGWLFYASIQMNPRNPFWRDVPALTAYITRCQGALQEGQPDNDILLYWPFEDLLHEPGPALLRQFTVHRQEWLADTPFGRLAALLKRRGWSCDYLSDAQAQALRAENGRLRAPGGSYAALLVPACRHLPVETLERLLSLAEAGATILFHEGLPADVPGLHDLPARRARAAALRDSLSFTTPADGPREAIVGSGRVLLGTDAEALLHAAGVPREALADAGLDFIRRRLPDGFLYFLANLGSQPCDGWLPLARTGAAARLEDPLTGCSGTAPLHGGPRLEMRVQLKPGESRLVRVQTAAGPGGGEWPALRPAGPAIELTGTWRIEFLEGGPVLPPAFSQERLASWTGQGGEAESFSGTARYRLEFDWKPLAAADDWRLDLGSVRESARVRLNGEPAGTTWSVPFECRVGGLLKPGRNVLEAEVTNLGANRVRDLDRRGVDWKRFGDIGLVNLRYMPFDASAWPVRPSGLLGPVHLIPLKKEPT